MDVSDFFYFFRSGERKGSPRRQEGGGWGQFFTESPKEGFSQEREGGGGVKGWEGA